MPGKSPYQPLSHQIDLPAIEKSILEFWKNEDIFHRSVTSRSGGASWTFYEGPPTANGMPGTHHIEARVFKDVFPRFHTMKGKHVIRKAGWEPTFPIGKVRSRCPARRRARAISK